MLKADKAKTVSGSRRLKTQINKKKGRLSGSLFELARSQLPGVVVVIEKVDIIVDEFFLS